MFKYYKIYVPALLSNFENINLRWNVIWCKNGPMYASNLQSGN